MSTDSSSGSGSTPDDVGHSIIPVAVPLDARPVLNIPDLKGRYKEHEVIAMAREFGLMPGCDIRTPGPEDNITSAREGELVVFKDSLKAGFRWPLHPFFIEFLVEHFMCPGQLVPNAWRMIMYFFIACKFLSIVPRLDLLRMVFELKSLPGYNCFAYVSTRGRFRIPKMPSSLKGWKQRYFFIHPQDPDHPFGPRWTIPDTPRFNEGQAYFEVLERDRQSLEDLEPLCYDLDDMLGDDILDLANVRGLEGRD